MKRCLLLLMFLALPVKATDPIKFTAEKPLSVPAEVKGDVGDFIAIQVETAGKVVKFVPLDTGLKLFPPELLATKKATVVSAARAGKYRVLIYSAIGDEPTDPIICTVVVGGGELLPDDEVTKLAILLKAAYSEETVGEKAYLTDLKTLYSNAIKHPDNTGLTTWGQIFETMSKESKVEGHLVKLQSVISKELKAISPPGTNSQSVLTTSDRASLKNMFSRISQALNTIK